MKKEVFYIDREMLKKAKERGFCLCDTKKTKGNSCPCSDFLDSGICKCGVFIKSGGREKKINSKILTR